MSKYAIEVKDLKIRFNLASENASCENAYLLLPEPRPQSEFPDSRSLLQKSPAWPSYRKKNSSRAGKRCLVIDKRDHIGGNIYTEDVDGIQVHKYGAHIFHTSNDAVWKYVNKRAKFNHYINSPVAVYKDE